MFNPSTPPNDGFVDPVADFGAAIKIVTTLKQGGTLSLETTYVTDIVSEFFLAVLRMIPHLTRDQFGRVMDVLEMFLERLGPIHLQLNFHWLVDLGYYLEELATKDDRPDLISCQLRIGDWRTLLKTRINIAALTPHFQTPFLETLGSAPN